MYSFSQYIRDSGRALTCTLQGSQLWGRFSKLLLSHNGIRLPSQIEHGLYPKRIDFSVKYPGAEARMALGLISLTDRMRPNLSVDRARIRNLPWEVYSAAGLATRRTAAELMQSPDDLFWCSNPLSPFDLINDATLGHLLCDPLLDAWANERIFVREEIDLVFPRVVETRSLGEVLEELNSGRALELDFRIRPEATHELCTAALAQSHLDLQVLRIPSHGMKARFLVKRRRVAPLQEWEKLFPPLCFVSFGHHSVLRGQAPIINRDHPFSTWFLEMVTILAEQYPGILHQVQTNLLEKFYRWDAAKALQTVNGALKRLGEIDPRLRPPKNVYLKPSDLRDDEEIAP